MTKVLLLLAALAVGGALQAQNAAAPSTGAGSAENGKKLWIKNNCYSCHGYDGHGGAGAKLAPKPIAVAAFIGIVRHPPKSSMPTFSVKVVSDADLRDIWAYLNTVPATPAVKDIPLLAGFQ